MICFAKFLFSDDLRIPSSSRMRPPSRVPGPISKICKRSGILAGRQVSPLRTNYRRLISVLARQTSCKSGSLIASSNKRTFRVTTIRRTFRNCAVQVSVPISFKDRSRAIKGQKLRQVIAHRRDEPPPGDFDTFGAGLSALRLQREKPQTAPAASAPPTAGSPSVGPRLRHSATSHFAPTAPTPA